MATEAKEELPFLSEEEIADTVRRFESCSLPYANWTHRAHLAVAVYYSRQMHYPQALDRIRNSIGLYNKTCGDPSGYNETITIVFMRKIYSELEQQNHCQLTHEEVARLSELCSVDWLYRYYSPDLIWSTKAKQQWLPPDRAEFDF